MQYPISLRRASFGAAFSVAVLTAACGARGPLDIVVIEEQPPPDAGADVSSSVDAPPDSPQVGPPVGLPGLDSGLAACGTCLVQNCGSEIGMCIATPSCQSTLQCVATMCLAGGSANLLGCVTTQCAGDSGLASLTSLFGLFQCVTGNCPTCTGALGGLLGGGGGGMPGG
jgi:hypothetical protein